VHHESAAISERSRLRWKGVGYLVSMVGVLLLGAIAWPASNDPHWHLPVLIAGIAASIGGMGLRYKAHLQQLQELRQTAADASQD
jgi:hypothetical protein